MTAGVARTMSEGKHQNSSDFNVHTTELLADVCCQLRSPVKGCSTCATLQLRGFVDKNVLFEPTHGLTHVVTL